MTEHDRQKRALGFPVRHNASQNKSLQNVFPIFECQMERRYKMQYTPFYYKNWCTGPLFFPWILHETGDGIKHVLTLLVVEMVRGIVHHHWVFASYVANLPARGWTKRLLNWNPPGRARPGPPNFCSFHVDTAPWDVGRMKQKISKNAQY